MKQNVWFVGILALVGLFLVLSSEILIGVEQQSDLVQGIDKFLFAQVTGLRTPWLSVILLDVTALGSRTLLTVATIVFSVLMLMLRRFDLLIHGIAASLGAGCLTLALKSHYLRERPPLSMRLVEVQGYSYPSGHSLASAATYLTLAYLFAQLFTSQTHRQVVMLGAALLVIVIGFSRVYLGVHYPSDVLAGLFLGVAWTMSLVLIRDFTLKQRRNRRSLKQSLVA